MRCIIAALTLAALVVSVASMAYADESLYKVQATLAAQGQAPQTMSYTPKGVVLLFKDEAACRHALINDQSIIDDIKALKASLAAHVTSVSVIFECVPAVAPSI